MELSQRLVLRLWRAPTAACASAAPSSPRRLYPDPTHPLQTAIENLGDAEDEIALNDDEGAVKLIVGECYIDVDGDYATEQVEKLKEEIEVKLVSHEKEQAAILGRQALLKEQLYGRFGKSINLEE